MKLFKRDYYEKMFIKRGKTVQDYQLQILHAQEKIMELQKQCKHERFTPVSMFWRTGSFFPQRVCNSCNAIVEGITEEESEKVWDDWNKPLTNIE